jgi:hypothetical protein
MGLMEKAPLFSGALFYFYIHYREMEITLLQLGFGLFSVAYWVLGLDI